jgi:superfamily II DNA or RNA helicase
MTATMPTQELKNVKTRATIGGDILCEVTTKFLSDEKMVSAANVEVITIDHPEIDDISNGGEVDWSWDLESHYTSSNVDRINAIAEYIESLEPTNTLILGHAGVCKMMAERLGTDLIVDDTATEDRKEMFTKFDGSDYKLVASFGTSGTGLSINRIFRLIMLDVGKNETHIKQSIGRGLRLDGDRDEVEVIDISSNTKYAKKHRRNRIKVYDRDEYRYFKSKTTITVKEA